MRPGITGLWQVEARDNPSFEAYVRLDLFYVQNWSLPLDLVILLGTVDHIVLRPLIKRMYRREDERRRAAELVAQGQAALARRLTAAAHGQLGRNETRAVAVPEHTQQ